METIKYCWLVCFDSLTASKVIVLIIALLSEADPGLVHIVIFACIFIRALCTMRLHFSWETHCGGSFDVLHLAHANLNTHICKCFKKCSVNRTTQE